MGEDKNQEVSDQQGYKFKARVIEAIKKDKEAHYMRSRGSLSEFRKKFICLKLVDRMNQQASKQVKQANNFKLNFVRDFHIFILFILFYFLLVLRCLNKLNLIES